MNKINRKRSCQQDKEWTKYCQHERGYKIELQYQVKVNKIEVHSPTGHIQTALHTADHQVQTIMRVLVK